MPFFSVVIPLYNKETFIEETLKSVLNQSFQDFEVIIVDDGSTDESFERTNKFKDSRIKIYHQNNQGLSSARNTGIKNANSDFIAFLDADDLWLPHHLQQLYNLINLYPEKGIYCNGYTQQKSNIVFQRANFNNLPQDFRGIVPNFFKHSLQNCIAWISSICIPVKVFNSVGYFDTAFFSEQDTDLYIRIALKYDVVLDNTTFSSIYNRATEGTLSNYALKKSIPKLFYAYKKEEQTNIYLKKFIDGNRFSLAIGFKLASNKKLAKELIEHIDIKNLNVWQKILIKLPGYFVKQLFFIKNKFYLKSLFIFKPKF
jgi:glycosyltransferase involved in cell wall biosynthesis